MPATRTIGQNFGGKPGKFAAFPPFPRYDRNPRPPIFFSPKRDMARNESDREDLLAEAVALTRRLEGMGVGQPPLITAGFRTNGWLSVYFGPDPMYQVDAEGRLRRAFVDGLLYRSQGETLAQLTRTRSPRETVLQRRDLTPTELTRFRHDMTTRLAELAEALDAGRFQVRRVHPQADATLTADIALRLRAALSADPWLSRRVNVRR